MGYDMYEQMGFLTTQEGPKASAQAEACSARAVGTYPARNANPSSNKNGSLNAWGPLGEGGEPSYFSYIKDGLRKCMYILSKLGYNSFFALLTGSVY